MKNSFSSSVRSDSSSLGTCGSSMRRAALLASSLELELKDNLLKLESSKRRMEWLRSLKDLDPRQQILNFFNDLSVEGVVSDFFHKIMEKILISSI